MSFAKCKKSFVDRVVSFFNHHHNELSYKTSSIHSSISRAFNNNYHSTETVPAAATSSRKMAYITYLPRDILVPVCLSTPNVGVMDMWNSCFHQQI